MHYVAKTTTIPLKIKENWYDEVVKKHGIIKEKYYLDKLKSEYISPSKMYVAKLNDLKQPSVAISSHAAGDYIIKDPNYVNYNVTMSYKNYKELIEAIGLHPEKMKYYGET